MSLTMPYGPLSAGSGARANFSVDGPERLLMLVDFPRRVRARFAGTTVLDTTRGALLYQSDRLPEFYVPADDVRLHLLEDTGEQTTDPVTGRARWHHLRVGQRLADHAVLAVERPPAEAQWLSGYLRVGWEAMDTWLDEDEQVHGQLRDPYHRVDVRDTSRHVRILAGRELIADSVRAKLLSETGLPNRLYVPLLDVRADLLESSPTRTVCPYKGTAAYWSLHVEGLALVQPDRQLSGEGHAARLVVLDQGHRDLGRAGNGRAGQRRDPAQHFRQGQLGQVQATEFEEGPLRLDREGGRAGTVGHHGVLSGSASRACRQGRARAAGPGSSLVWRSVGLTIQPGAAPSEVHAETGGSIRLSSSLVQGPPS